MFLDASAIIAIIARESDAATLERRLAKAEQTYVSPVVIYEAVAGLARLGQTSIGSAEEMIDAFLENVDAEVIPITAQLGRDALAAFSRFGKGRHAAALNMGDCFAYACAQHLATPLLCKGDDFRRTDITLAS